MRIQLRFFTWSLALLLTAWLPELPAAETATRFRVGFAQDTLANDWREVQAREIARGFAERSDIEFILTDGRGSTARQILDIEDLIASKVDLLITSPRDGLAMTPVITQAHERGTPVILITRRIANEAFTTFIGADDREIGQGAARYMVDALNGEGTILMLKGVPTATTAIERTDGFMEVMADHPRIQVIERTGNYLRADTIQVMEELFEEGVTFDAIYGQSDSMVQGALLALEKAEIDPEPLVIVGIDYISAAREAIRDGRQDASFIYPTCAREAVDAALAILEGRMVPRRIIPASVMVTRDNVDTVEPIF